MTEKQSAADLKNRVLLLHGPNLNLLGIREPEKYGHTTLADVEQLVTEEASRYGFEVDTFQSNHEGDLIDKLHEYRQAAGVILNPGALSHYSYAIHDAMMVGPAPVIEVHVTNIYARDQWRHHSVVSAAASGSLAGFGVTGYKLAVLALAERYERKRSE